MNIENTQELTPQEKKRLYMREYMRKYQKEKLANDPDFAEKHRKYVRDNLNNRWKNDAEYKEKKKEADKIRYNKYKEAYNTLKSQKE